MAAERRRRSALILAAFLASSCAPSEEQRRTALIDEIERVVRLPASSRPLREYARYYALDAQGRVVGLYSAFPSILPNDLSPGQRAWIERPTEMPLIEDGGCDVVNVLFDPRSHRVEGVYCNFDA